MAQTRHPRRRSPDHLLPHDRRPHALHPHRQTLAPHVLGLPYDFSRGIWPDIPLPLVWDPSAVNTYLLSSILFVFIALVPDLAVVRDRSSGIRRIAYSVLSLGWRGTPRQWKLQAIAGILLSALILPVFVSVHSIVSWDFGMAVSVNSWHSTIFAPYFVIGAVHSGVSGVVTVMIFMRWLFGWEDYVRREHIDALGRLLIVIAVAWFYFFAMEFLFGIYGQEGDELATRSLQMFSAPWGWLFLAFIITSFFFPVPLWLFRNVRRSFLWMTITTISVNIACGSNASSSSSPASPASRYSPNPGTPTPQAPSK